MKYLIFYFLAAWSSLLAAMPAKAAGIPETVKLYAVGKMMEDYAFSNQGRMPTSWAQLYEGRNPASMNKMLVGDGVCSFRDRYHFVTQPMPFRGSSAGVPEGSQVLLIRSVPLVKGPQAIQGRQNQRRYLIYGTPNGRAEWTSVSEEEVQSMLTSAGVTLTPKLGLPAVETEERVSQRATQTANPADVEFLKLHPELDPLRKATISTVPSHEGPVAEPNSEVPSNANPAAQSPSAPLAVPVPAADEGGVSLWLIGGPLVLGLGVGVWLVRFAKRSRK
jgi:hypothetical protein